MCGEPRELGIIFDCGYEHSSTGVSLENQLCVIGEIALLTALFILGALGVYYLMKKLYKKY